ncbi:MAG TPA: tRNA (adenosine(37)-N6)-dimethylallyltransferase MiaA [Pyrinomonadaceae bacterium]
MDQRLKPVVAIVGPTASGKSELGIEIALRFGGEIINCDSVQVYSEIEVATAKVPIEERRGVPHHLIDFVPPRMNYTAGDWARDAAAKIAEIEARSSLALLVGGTGLYLRALRQPFFEGPATDGSLRQRLARLREKKGVEHLYRILLRVDPAAAAKLYRRDWSRVQRALEVYFQTGRRISEAQRQMPSPPEFVARLRVIALAPPREEIYSRINKRVEQWFGNRLLEEVQSLIASGVPLDARVFKALGYRHMLEHLQGKSSREEALDQMKIDERRYAKRQLTWFRREPDVKWIDKFGDDPRALREAVEFLEDEF